MGKNEIYEFLIKKKVPPNSMKHISDQRSIGEHEKKVFHHYYSENWTNWSTLITQCLRDEFSVKIEFPNMYSI